MTLCRIQLYKSVIEFNKNLYLCLFIFEKSEIWKQQCTISRWKKDWNDYYLLRYNSSETLQTFDLRLINQISPINIPVRSIHFFELKIISIHLKDQISIF